jgi:tetratricopeptide (TPR) repeat protein
VIGFRRLRHLGRRRIARHLEGSLTLGALLRVHPDVRDELMWEAARRLDAGATAEAKALYLLALRLWIGEAADACLGLAACEEAEGNLPQALALYDTLLEGAPDHLLARVNRAALHLRAGRPDAARADLDAAEAALATARRVPKEARRRLAELREHLADPHPSA